tara:strand:- start:4202 stop:4963 length:762 start_codon:yes stop_codon:yes gene_type:complete
MDLDIKEINNENIKLSKMCFSCDGIDDSIPAPLPQKKNFFLGLIGKPGSGKTSLLMNLITKRNKCFNRKFDKVFLFSPSLATDKDSKFSSLPPDQIYDELSVENLEEVLKRVKGSGDDTLLILDDVINDITKSTELQRNLCRVIMNRRHLTTDGENGTMGIIMTTQVAIKIPAPIRKCLTHLVLFNTSNKKELQTIFDEFVSIPKKKFIEVLKYCWRSKHDFIYLNLEEEIKNQFHNKFNKLVFDVENEYEIR